jgi:hypothetical protein
LFAFDEFQTVIGIYIIKRGVSCDDKIRRNSRAVLVLSEEAILIDVLAGDDHLLFLFGVILKAHLLGTSW